MLKPINSIIKDSISNIMFRGNVVTGIVATDNGDGSYDVFISESDRAYPKIFTLSRNPDLAVGDKVRILYKNGCKELPIILPPVKPTAPPEEYELTFDNNYRAVCGKYSSNSYADAHNAIYSSFTAGNPSGILIKQDAWFPSGSYIRWNVYRGFFYWDTSTIPAEATIVSAEVQLYIRLNWTYRTFNIIIQNGQPSYPANPINSFSYYKNLYSGDGGSIGSGSISTDDWNTIPLNDDGKSWINIGGETKFCFRVSRDIDNDSPGNPAEGESAREEGIQVYSDPASGIYAKLYIKYTL